MRKHLKSKDYFSFRYSPFLWGGLSMDHFNEFSKMIVDSITDHIVVLDKNGNIKTVNRAWTEFAIKNDCLNASNWKGRNYLNVCDHSASMLFS